MFQEDKVHMRQTRQKVNSFPANLVLSGHLGHCTCEAACTEEGVSSPAGGTYSWELCLMRSAWTDKSGFWTSRAQTGCRAVPSPLGTAVLSHTQGPSRVALSLFMEWIFLNDRMLFPPNHKISFLAPASVAQWMEHCPVTKRSWVWFPGRAHNWVAGLSLVQAEACVTPYPTRMTSGPACIPGMGAYEGNQQMLLSWCFSLSLPLYLPVSP